MTTVLLFFRIVVSIFYLISISFSQDNNVHNPEDNLIFQYIKTLDHSGKAITSEQFEFLKTLIQKTISGLRVEKNEFEYIAKMYHCAQSLRTIIENAHILNLINPHQSKRTAANISSCVLREMESRNKLLKDIFKEFLYNVAKEYMCKLKPKFNMAYDNFKLLNLNQLPTNPSPKSKQLHDVLLKLKNSQDNEEALKVYIENENVILQSIDYEWNQKKKVQGITFSEELQQLIGSENLKTFTQSVIELLIEVKELNLTIFHKFEKQCENLTFLRINSPNNLDCILKDTENILVDKNLAQALLDLCMVSVNNNPSIDYQNFLNNEVWISRARRYELEDKFLKDLPYTKDANTLNKMTDFHLEGAKLYVVEKCSFGLDDYKIYIRAYIHFLKKNNQKDWTDGMANCVYTLIKADSNAGFGKIIDDLKDEKIVSHTCWTQLPEEEIIVKVCAKIVKLYTTISEFDIHTIKPLPRNCQVGDSDYKKFLNALKAADPDMKDVAIVLSKTCLNSNND